MIDALISKVMEELGFGADKANAGVGTLFALMQKFGDAGPVAALLDKIPGASALAEQFMSKTEMGGGMSGGLSGLVGGLVGGKAGDAMAAIGALKGAGIDLDDAKKLAPLVAGFAKEQAGDDLVSKAFESMPFIKELL